MSTTRRALIIAVVGTVVAALAWPDGAERVGRAALVLVAAALVTDLVLLLRRAVPLEETSPFAPPRAPAGTASVPRGLLDLQREVRLMGVEGRRLPISTRLYVTSRAAAEARLRLHGIDLADPDDAPAARALLGNGPYDFVSGASPTVAPDELLAALEGGT